MKDINFITGEIVDSALKIHSTIGPGLLEGVYEACMVHELRKRGLVVLPQVILPVFYDGIQVEVGYRLDLLVEDQVIAEVKAVEKIIPVHEAQLLTYLRLTKLKIGLLLNFHEFLMKNGIKRIANNF